MPDPVELRLGLSNSIANWVAALIAKRSARAAGISRCKPVVTTGALSWARVGKPTKVLAPKSLDNRGKIWGPRLKYLLNREGGIANSGGGVLVVSASRVGVSIQVCSLLRYINSC